MTRPLRLLFFLRAANYDRHFEAALRELLGRGHEVHIALDVAKKGNAGSTQLFDRLAAEGGDLTHGLVPERRRPHWLHFGTQLRLGIDFLRYLDPRFADADVLRRRAEERAPWLVTRLARLPIVRRPAGIRLLDRVLRALERSLPIDTALTGLIDDQKPDVVLVSPLVGLGSPQGDYVRAARLRGIPSVFLVASWDNLTNKGVVRDAADLTVVWNPDQLRECVELHALEESSVRVVGAHTYDHWFDWQPSTTRDAFLAKVGLRPDRVTVLYVCSSGFIAPDEAAFVARWIQMLRGSSDPRLREANVLVRPHPAHTRIWNEANLSDPGRVAVWPTDGAMPTTDEAKSDYFDSIQHADLVVGINTSALVESAIVGKPVFTLVSGEHAETQEGTLHFHYLARENGVLTVARTEEEHLVQLAEALADKEAFQERCARFVNTFLRPSGRATAAAPLLAAAVEEAATHECKARRTGAGQVAVRALLSLPVRVGVPVGVALRTVGKARRRPGAIRGAERDPRRPLRVLFFFDHAGSLLHFDETINRLAARGHRVHVAFARGGKYEHALDVVGANGRNVMIHERAPRRTDRYAFALKAYWALMDYIHYLDPSLEGARFSRGKWRSLAPMPFGLRWLGRSETLSRPRVRFLLRRLRGLADAVPTCRAIDRFLARISPDVLLVSPLVTRSGQQSDYVKSARRLGIRTAFCLSSWDNLTSKGLIREEPDSILVWNETQRYETIEHHGVESARIVTTGAQQFDRWFDREPSTDREGFLAPYGLPPDKPVVLFVSSTQQYSTPDMEPKFLRSWLEAVRACDDPDVRDISVLVRPHPTDLERWNDADFSDLGRVAIWRREQPLPVGADARSDYFDGMYHSAAVLGINSTAMVEATVIDRPVLTVCLPEFEAHQHDLIHYHYLREERGGFLREAPDFETHIRQLGEELRTPKDRKDVRARFVDSFVRPHGAGRTATEVLIDEIERSATLEPTLAKRHALRKLPARLLAVALGLPVALLGTVHRTIRRGAARLRRRVQSRAGLAAFLARLDDRSRRRLKRLGAAQPAGRRKRAKDRAAAADRPKRGSSLQILFFIRHAGYIKNFQSTIVELAERGHRIEFVVEDWKSRWLAKNPLKSLAVRYPDNISYSKEPAREKKLRSNLLRNVRGALDYVHYCRAEFDDKPKLRARATRRAPRFIVVLGPLLRIAFLRRVASRLLCWLERFVPEDPAITRFFADRRPDVAVITPLVHLRSVQHDYLAAATRRDIPSVVSVASWDNLTSKGAIRRKPTAVIVWNETQRAEAVALHGVDPERVIATGAQTYDHWFDWTPSRTRDELALEAGLPAGVPFVLYLCSSRFVAPDEVSFLLRWAEAVRITRGLEDVGILVRPHFQNLEQWDGFDSTDLSGFAVWPPRGDDPVGDAAKQRYFDSMYHCSAVIGINTSALIESAIVGRRVFTVAADDFRETQDGTHHFAYLAEGERPLLVVSQTLEEHTAKLAAALAEPERAQRNNAFVKAFVRPHGLGSPATPRVVATIERVGERRPLPAQARVQSFVTVPRRAHHRMPTPRRLWRRYVRPALTAPVRATLVRLPLPAVQRRLTARTERNRALAQERARIKAVRAREKQKRRKAAVVRKSARERQKVG